ncbi:MAG: hypothetical protein NTV63_04435 [Candidatus Woesearchaeota archaeon]|nr:hypothetical protein [Candidatus Woesearchaeota archaeon]
MNDSHKSEKTEHSASKGFFNSLRDKAREIYIKQYKALLVIVLIIGFSLIGILLFNFARTGEFFQRDISLKGGVSVTISRADIGSDAVESALSASYPKSDINVRLLKSAGASTGIAIESSDLSSEQIISSLNSNLGKNIKSSEYNVDMIGSSLGEAFFRQTIQAIIFAFILMAVTVFLYFRIPIPSFFVVWCAFLDIVSTIAVVSIFGIRMSTAGIAALLVLIGYSVSSDILLTARVVKGKNSSVIDNVFTALGTGLTMTWTTIAALLAGFFMADSEVIKQIMLIMIIGLVFDSLYTWIMNVSILRIYMEKREKAEIEKKRAAHESASNQ